MSTDITGQGRVEITNKLIAFVLRSGATLLTASGDEHLWSTLYSELSPDPVLLITFSSNSNACHSVWSRWHVARSLGSYQCPMNERKYRKHLGRGEHARAWLVRTAFCTAVYIDGNTDIDAFTHAMHACMV